MISPRSIGVVIACAAILALGAPALDAQERIRVSGWVQWIGGTTMQLMTGSGTVAVDLRQADQGSYQSLRTGDRVLIDGTVATDRSRVIARTIWRESGEFQAP